MPAVVLLLLIVGLGHSAMIRQLIYFPEKTVSDTDLAELKAAGFHPFEDRGYLRGVAAPKRVVVIFHGNAGHAGQRLYLARGFFDEDTVVFLAEYPGYGARKGSPSEEAITHAALDDVKKLQQRFPSVPVYFVGESLGTGVVSYLAGKIPAAGLILAAPFTSLVEVGKKHYPFLPVTLFLADRYDSLAHLKGVKIPLLIIHGKRDDIVPFALGKELYDSYEGPKEFLSLENYGHNDLPWHDVNGVIWQKIRSWW